MTAEVGCSGWRHFEWVSCLVLLEERQEEDCWIEVLLRGEEQEEFPEIC